MFDLDFSHLTGEFADLDGDGEVSMDEYLNEEDDYNRIMGSEDDDDDLDCDEDEDFDDDYGDDDLDCDTDEDYGDDY